jgi:ATP-dependent DNA helicase RecG
MCNLAHRPGRANNFVNFSLPELYTFVPPKLVLILAEDQNIEYKQTWRDEYLKWICGFANAQGGKIYIGIDDQGEVTGAEEYKKLMDDIPVSTVPISYHGAYHYRSGSTKQELKGAALHKFLLQKIGVSWEQQIAPAATLDDIDQDTVKRFLQKAILNKRISEHAASSDTLTLFRNLALINEKGESHLANFSSRIS